MGLQLRREKEAGTPSLYRTIATEVLHPCVLARVGGDVAGATFVRSTLPVAYAVAGPALRKVREWQGTRCCGGFYSLKAGSPGQRYPHAARRIEY